MPANALTDLNIPQPTAPDIVGGMQLGMDLAAKQHAMQIQNQEMQFKRAQLEQQKVEHVAGLFDKAAESYKTDTALGDVMMDHAVKTSGVLKVPVDDGYVQTFKKSQQFRDWYQGQIKNVAPGDYNSREQIFRTGGVDAQGNKIPPLGDVIGGKALADAAEKAGQPANELANSQALAGGKVAAVKEEGTQKRLTDMLPFATPTNAKILQSGNTGSPEFIKAYGETQAQFNDYKQRQQNADIAAKKSTAAHADAEAAAIPKKLSIDQENATTGRMRATLQTSEALQNVVNKTVTDTAVDRKSLVEVANAKSLLVPGATLNQANMAAQGLERAMTGSARVAAQTLNGVKLNDMLSNFQQKFAAWRIGKQADAQVPPGLLANYNDIADKLNSSLQNSIKGTAAVTVSGAVRNKLTDKQGAKALMESLIDPSKTQKFLDDIGAVDPSKAPPSAGGLKIPSAAFLNSLKDKIGDPGARANFLKQNGYDASGVK